MIDSRIYIKSLNATEAGESNTNDSYILVPKMFDASDFFGLSSGSKKLFEATDPEENIRYNLRFELTSKTQEQRIYMLGAFCKKKGLHAGDTISLEHLTVDDDSTFIIRYRRLNNIVLLQKMKGDYLVERNDVGNSLFGSNFRINMNGTLVDFKLSFLYNGKKRNDSPDSFDFYDATIDNKRKLSEFIKDSYVIIDFDKMEFVPFEKTTEYRITQE